MAQENKVALRYARAVLDLADVEELKTVKKYFAGSRFTQLLSVPIWSAERRQKTLEEVIKSMGVSENTRKVLLVIFQMGRLNILDAIIDNLIELQLEKEDKILLQVRSSQELSKEQKDLIEKKFKGVFGKEVYADFNIEPGLLGGLKVSANGKVYDGTVVGWLDQIQAFAGG